VERGRVAPSVTPSIHTVFVEVRPGDAAGQGDHRLHLSSADEAQLHEVAAAAARDLSAYDAYVAGDDQPTGLTFEVDAAACARLGVDSAAVREVLDLRDGVQVSTLFTQTSTRHIVLRWSDPGRAPEWLAHVYAPSKAGQVPLSSLAHATVAAVPGSIAHDGQKRALDVRFSASPGDFSRAKESISLPAAVTIAWE